MSEITWAMPVVLDLFFAGLAAGAFLFSVLMSRKRGEAYQACARAGAILAPVAVAFGLSMLILDLRYKTRFWYTMTVLNTDSPMSLGVWLLSLFSLIATLYAVFWIPAGLRVRIPLLGRWLIWEQAKTRDHLGVLGVPVALLVSIYTGVLLSATSIPLWRNLALPLLFCFSSLATGFAAGLLLSFFSSVKRRDIISGPFEWLRRAYRVLLPSYVLSALLYVLLFFVPISRQAEIAPLLTGVNGLIWWVGVVGMGMLLPLILGFSKAKAGSSIVYIVLGALLAGGVLLRYLLVYSGQMDLVTYMHRLAQMP